MSERYGNGYVALVVALCICISSIGLTSSLVFYSKGYESADYEHQADRANRDSGEKAYQECLSANVTIEEARGCIAEHANATRDAERSEQDLSAQRQMAKWAEGMLWATILIGVASVSFTGLGVYWVKRTFEQGNDLAKAALEANEIMLREQRPWVKIWIAQDVRVVRDGETYISYRIEAENIGKTPAYDVTIKSKLALIFDPYEIQDSEEHNERIWNISENAQRLRRNRAGSAMLPGSKTFQTCEDELGAAKATQLDQAKIAIALKVEYFTPMKRAKFKQSGVMFELLNPQDMCLTCELFDLADVKDDKVVWQHQGCNTYMT